MEALRALRRCTGTAFTAHVMGERGPVDDPLARGALVGLTLRYGYAGTQVRGLSKRASTLV